MAQDDTTAQSVDLESPENILVFELSTGVPSKSPCAQTRHPSMSSA
ncbi:hypothetical protein [Hankyongella ginsenosidimutans]|nr:hypothetical protein [Hankyongella ginsenosidimutans]